MRHLVSAVILSLFCAAAVWAEPPSPFNATRLGDVTYSDETFQIRCYEAGLCSQSSVKGTARDVATTLTKAHEWAQSLGFNKSLLAQDPAAKGVPMIAFIRPPNSCGNNALACATGPKDNGGSLIPKTIELPEDHITSTSGYASTLGHEYAHTLQRERAQNPNVDWLKEASANVMGYEFARSLDPGFSPATGPNTKPRALDVSPFDTDGYGFAGYVSYLGKQLKTADGVSHLKPWYLRGFRTTDNGNGVEYLYDVPTYEALDGTTVSQTELPKKARFDELFPRYIAETANDPDKHGADYDDFESEILQPGMPPREQTVQKFAAQSLNIKAFADMPPLEKGEIAIVEITALGFTDPDSLTLIHEDKILDGFDLTLAFGPNQLAADQAGFLRMVNAPKDPGKATVQSYAYEFNIRTVKIEIPECVVVSTPIIPMVIGDLGSARTISMRTEPGGETMIAPSNPGTVEVQVVVSPPVPRATGLAPDIVSLGTLEVKEVCEPQTSNADITTLYFDWSLKACEVLWAWQQQVEQMLVDAGRSDHGQTAFQGMSVYQVMPPGTLQDPGLQMACAMTLGLLKRHDLIGDGTEIPGSAGLLKALERYTSY